VKPEATRHTWTCGHVRSHRDQPCGAPAEWHGVNLYSSDPDEVPGMKACVGHRGDVRMAADAVHPIDSACGLPGARFDQDKNCCYLPGMDAELEQLLSTGGSA